jgi:site-specific DNA-methyltransferase (adenine-specific)
MNNNIFFKNELVSLYHQDCLEIIKTWNDNIIDTIITDPPYFLGLMQKSWDMALPKIEIWKELLRVSKPGAILMAFGHPRTFHRLACVIEDAGWELLDTISWMYGKGMPKGLNIGNALKKKEKKENISLEEEINKWNGWATTLKPSWEPITVAMKPCEGGFVDNALKWGVCGFNIDECRIELQKEGEDKRLGGEGSWRTNKMAKSVYGKFTGDEIGSSPKGRFPSNTILSHHPDCKMVGLKKVKSDVHYSYKVPDNKGVLNFGFKKMKDQVNPHTSEDGLETVEEWNCHPDCPVKILDDQSGILKSGNNCVRKREGRFLEHGSLGKSGDIQTTYGDVGTASRFFYCTKADSDDRFFYCTICNDAYPRTKEKEHMHSHPEGDIKHLVYHPAVKPQGILKFLVRLSKTPSGGTVLDPFCGSGSMALACLAENRKFIGIDQELIYCKISKKRVELLAEEKGTLFN